jgi:hypothetical protein
MPDTVLNISPDELKAAAQVIADSMPEYSAFQHRLLAESPNVRRGVVNLLHDWAHDPTTGMTPAERRAFVERCKEELRRRGEPVD